MNREEIQDLYRQHILPESKVPYHFERRESGKVVKAYNPMCGDKYELFIQQTVGVIDEVYFHGFGCAISKAATSMLLRKIEGMTDQKAAQYCRDFLNALDAGDGSSLADETLKTLVALKNFEGRVDCIKLSWEALLNTLEHDKSE